MKSLSDRNLVRQYLLGRLDDNPDLEGDLSEAILSDDELAAMVDSVEDEIIEEYLDETLDSVDKNAVDEYFLRPLERKEKLRFAQLLRHRFKTKRDLAEPQRDAFPLTGPSLVEGKDDDRSAVQLRSRFQTYGQFAALILLAVLSLLYASRVRESKARLEGELVQERERSASLAQEALLLRPPMVALTLVADRSRSADAQIPRLEIKPSTQRMIVDIALPGAVSGPYDVRLETSGGERPIWSARLLPLVSASGDGRLVFDVPVQGIKPDVYSFVVSSPSPGGVKHYDFEVKLTR
jgi:hypothetical protein